MACHYRINFTAFPTPKCCLFPPEQGEMGSYATGNPTAATHPASNCQTFIALNASHQTREVLQPWVFTFFFSFFKSYGFFFFFNFFFFIVIKTKVCVLAHGPSNAIYSCGLFNQSSTSKHKGPMIWGTNVCASTGTNAQLIRAFTSARRVNNLVQGYDV